MVSTIRRTPGVCQGLPVGTEGGAEGPQRPSAARVPGHAQAPKAALTRGARRRHQHGPRGRPGRPRRGSKAAHAAAADGPHRAYTVTDALGAQLFPWRTPRVAKPATAALRKAQRRVVTVPDLRPAAGGRPIQANRRPV